MFTDIRYYLFTQIRSFIMEIEVKFKGEPYALCCGKWFISIDGKELQDLDNEPFNTFGTYSKWKFVKNYDVIWEKFTDGLHPLDWVRFVTEFDHNNLITAIKKQEIEPTKELLLLLYEKINECDFRRTSCGGCI